MIEPAKPRRRPSALLLSLALVCLPTALAACQRADSPTPATAPDAAPGAGATDAPAVEPTTEAAPMIDGVDALAGGEAAGKAAEETEDAAVAAAEAAQQRKDADPEAGLREAAASYAEDFGVTPEEAAKRLRAQAGLEDALAKIAERLGEGYAGAYIEHRPELRAVVRVVAGTDVGSELEALVGGAAAPIELVEVDGPGLDELTRRLEAALPKLQELGAGLGGAEIDERTGEFVLFYQLGEAARGVTPEQRRRAQAEAQRLLDGQVRFEEVEGEIGDGHTRGGANISGCTAGFVVRHPLTGTTGYITAGHCGNTQTYAEFGGASYGTPFIDEIRDADQDVQWHTTPHIELPQFYASSTSSARPLQGRRTRAQQSVGGYVCHRGQTTGYSCGTIDSKTFAPTYTNACPGTTCSAVWVRVSGNSLECFPGDSGGPWFLVYDAYGIYKGQSSSGTDAAGCSWAFYMASNYFGIDLEFE